MNNVRIADDEFVYNEVNNIIRIPLVYSLKDEGIETIRQQSNLPDVWGLPDITVWYGKYDTILLYYNHNHNIRVLEPLILDYRRYENRDGQEFIILQLPFECLKDNVRRWILNHVVEEVENVQYNDVEERILSYYSRGNLNHRRDTFHVVLPIYDENLENRVINHNHNNNNNY